MNVKTAEINTSKTERGLFISFLSTENLRCGDFLEIKVEDSLYPFEVVYISIMNNLLIIRAKETGYFARQLNNKKDLDLRNLINAEIFIITDKVRIREIKEQSSWC